jgi:CheY-like chemotaxis protein
MHTGTIIMNTVPLVLIVEDSPTQARRFAALLASYHVQTIVAANGLDGLREAAAHLPELIILDVNLPVMDGFQVCRRLKRDKETAHIPVVMLTASESADMTIQGLEAGADDYIPKDVWAEDNLIATLNTYLNLDKR